MKSDIYNYNKYGDNVARKKWRHFFLKVLVVFAVFLGLSVISIYFLFFSKFLQINEQNIEGLQTLTSGEIYPILDSIINKTAFGISSLKLQKNMIFFNDELVRSKILSSFPVVEEVEIKKEYPHKIIVQIKERSAIGTWCFNKNDVPAVDSSTLLTTGCRYFDQNGVLWGKALKSSGSLFLTIEDMRSSGSYLEVIEPSFQEALKQVVTGLGRMNIVIRKISIPDDSINDLQVHTARGYRIIFNADSEVNKQIESLKIFLANQSQDFKPEYIDARINGRIYYK